MQPSKRIPLSRFPADLLNVLLLPGTAIFYVVASYLPRFLRGTVFAILGVLFIAAAFHLARSSRRVVAFGELLFVVGSMLILVGLFLLGRFWRSSEKPHDGRKLYGIREV